MSDAAHMLSDTSSFAVSLFAAYIVSRRSHIAYSFGYHRVEILGALISVLIIWMVTGTIRRVNRKLELELLESPVPLSRLSRC